MKDLVPVDKLTPEQMAEPYNLESLSRAEKEINYLNARLNLVSRISLVMIFELGKRLAAIRDTLDHGQFLPWLEEHFPSSERTARNYMKLYARFREEPAELLDDMTIQEAYIEAGVKKATNPAGDDADDGQLKVAGRTDPLAEKANMVEVFRRKTLSGKPLQNHRVENVNGRIYVYRKDVGTVSPAMDLFLGRPRGLPDMDWLQMQTSFVIATELYLLKVEEYEERGVVSAPEDTRLLSVMDTLEHADNADDERQKVSA